MKITETKKGELAIFASSFIGSFYPVVVAASLKIIPPLVALFFSVFITVIFYAILMSATKTWQSIKTKKVWKDLLVSGIFVAFGYYFFSFLGLKFTSPGNASIVSLMEIFFSFMLFHVWKKEEFSFTHIFGAFLMVFGALIVLLPKSQGIQKGDFFILVASMLAPIGNYFQRKARKVVSSHTIVFWRWVFALPFIALSIFIFKENFVLKNLGVSFWYLLINGVILLGLNKILWLESIHRIPVTKAVSLSSFSPVITIMLAYFFLDQKPVIWQFFSLVPIILGIILLTKPVSGAQKTAENY